MKCAIKSVVRVFEALDEGIDTGLEHGEFWDLLYIFEGCLQTISYDGGFAFFAVGAGKALHRVMRPEDL